MPHTRRTPILAALCCAVLTSLLPGAQADDSAWTSLFNGKDLTGWTPKFVGHEAGVNLLDTFSVEDGILKVCYDQYTTFDNRFGHLFYAQPFSNYVLRVEYRFVGEQVPGGPDWAFRNNGIMVHGQAPETMQKDQKFPVSIEVQLLGGKGEAEGERTTLNVCTPGTHVTMDGKRARGHCNPSRSRTYHGDQWVTVEIVVRGCELIEHRIDGKTVLAYTRPQLDPTDASAKPLITGEDTLLRGGTLSIQAESHPTEFRRIDIRPLTP